MRFFHALAFASVALGAPNFVGDLESRAQTPIASITLSLKTAVNTCGSQNNVIRKSLLKPFKLCIAII